MGTVITRVCDEVDVKIMLGRVPRSDDIQTTAVDKIQSYPHKTLRFDSHLITFNYVQV